MGLDCGVVFFGGNVVLEGDDFGDGFDGRKIDIDDDVVFGYSFCSYLIL